MATCTSCRPGARDPANPGQPLHIVDGRDVLVSFGAEYGPGDDPLGFNPVDERYAATAPDGSIMVAHQREYRIEAWSRDGRLLGSLTGPDLGSTRFEPGEVTPDNPLPNQLVDLHVDASGRVWVSRLDRRADWVDRSEEDPTGGLMPAGMDILNWFRTRIDLIDVETCTMLASHVQDPFFLDFVEDGLVSDVEFTPEGAPLVNLKRIGMGGGAGAPEDDPPAQEGAPAEEMATAAEEFATGWRVDPQRGPPEGHHGQRLVSLCTRARSAGRRTGRLQRNHPLPVPERPREGAGQRGSGDDSVPDGAAPGHGGRRASGGVWANPPGTARKLGRGRRSRSTRTTVAA